MVALIKAVYKKGVFEPIEPMKGLAENEQVTLQVTPVVSNGMVDDLGEEEEEPAFWSDPEGDAEWAAMTPAEQQGQFRRKKTSDAIEARLRWIDENWARYKLPSDQALEIATAEWLAEENQDV